MNSVKNMVTWTVDFLRNFWNRWTTPRTRLSSRPTTDRTENSSESVPTETPMVEKTLPLPEVLPPKSEKEPEVFTSSEEITSLLSGLTRNCTSTEKSGVPRKVATVVENASPWRFLHASAKDWAGQIGNRLQECIARKNALQNHITPPRNPSASKLFARFDTVEKCQLASKRYQILHTLFSCLSVDISYDSIGKQNEMVKQCAVCAATIIASFRTFHETLADPVLLGCRKFLLEEIANPLRQTLPFMQMEDTIPSPEKIAGATKKTERLSQKFFVELDYQNLDNAVQNLQKAPEKTPQLCDQVREAVERLRQSDTLSQNAARLRKIFLPVLDYFPEDDCYSSEFHEVVQATLRYRNKLEKQDSQEPSSQEVAAEDTDVQKVRDYLTGKKVVLVGGQPMAHITDRVEQAFGCEVLWDETSHSESLNRYQSLIHDPEVGLFVVFVKWASHKHVEQLCQMVFQAGKKAVRLHNETNPLTMAKKIVNMCL